VIIVERINGHGMSIRIRLNDGNHDFTEKAALDLVLKLGTVGISTPAPKSDSVRNVVDELSHIPRLELLRKIMQNVEDLINHQSYLRHWWERSPNWVKVQAVINNNTSKAGSTSSTRECVNIGINPDGYSTRDIVPPLAQTDKGGV